MALALGVAALFFGVAFVIVGWKGGGTDAMNQNIAGMFKGEYLIHDNPQVTNVNTSKPKKTGSTSTTGGAHGH
jgi:hypothetical protein